VFGPHLIGVVLTGANFDGSKGLKRVKQRGGLAVVQEPAEAEASQMPRAALAATEVDHVVPLAGIAPLLEQLATAPAAAQETA
jgi:two-component system chemotaxis response regulator CheB